MQERTKCLIIGTCAGAANGFFGAGGGLFLVPLFTAWLGMEQKRAFATSVAIIFPLSAVSVLIYLQNSSLPLRFSAPFLFGGVLGVMFSGLLFSRVSVPLPRKACALRRLWGGVRAVLLL